MTEDVLTTTQDRVGRIRLNRPKAIHALTTQMCEVMSQALLKWRSDSSVEVVVIDHAEGRGFCAGGEAFLLRRISPQPSTVYLSEADRGDHGRDHDGRRGRHLAAVRVPHRHRK